MAETDPLTASLVLLDRYQGGDEAALDKLMTRYYPRVERIVRARMGGFLHSRMEVEDVLQQVFIRAIRDIQELELREDAALIHWLSRLVQNELANLARDQKALKRDARREQAIEQPTMGGLNSVPKIELSNGDPRLMSQVANRELEEILDGCISELEPKHRDVILHRDYAGGSWEWVAEQLESPSPEAARKLYSRAMIELSKLVEERT